MARELYNRTTVSQLLKPLIRTADATSSALDMKGFDSALLIADVGTSGDTLSGSVKLEFEVQHSDASGSGYVACADSDIIGEVAGTNAGTFALIDDPAEDDATYRCAYIGAKRYVRVVANHTGAHSSGIDYGVVAVQGHGRHLGGDAV